MYQVTIHIQNICDQHIAEPLYLAGTFNNWSAEHLLIGEIPAIGEKLTYILKDVPEGDLEIKLSRGSWSNLQANLAGELLDAVEIQVQNNVELDLEIHAWRDQFPISTASPQVHILDKHFYFPELAVYRQVWIYLPKDYEQSLQRYPVIYMHDGQHLFDEATSVGRAGPIEWKVDKVIDQAVHPAIVVAIDHAQDYRKREQEFLMHPTEEVTNPLGNRYLDDIVHTLKPYVDKHYRTKTEASSTAILGSSLGGLISMYAGINYPEVFGMVVAFSPSIWMDEQHLTNISQQVYKDRADQYQNQALYFYVGGREQRKSMKLDMRADLERYYQTMESIYPGNSQIHIFQEGKHGARYWQQAFRAFYSIWQEKFTTN